MPTPPLSDEKKKWIRLMKRAGKPNHHIAEKLGVSKGTVSNFTRDISTNERTKIDDQIEEKILAGWSERKIMRTLKVHDQRIKRVIAGLEADKAVPAAAEFVVRDVPCLPDSFPDGDVKDTPHVKISKPGNYLILSDIHFNSHDKAAIDCAIRHGKKRGVVGVILNGDILDNHELSRFDKSTKVARYVDEIKTGQDFLSHLRSIFPKADIWQKDGNHEHRTQPYIWNRAPAFEGLDCLSMESLLEMRKHGVGYVKDKTLIQLGGLLIAHGHEFGPGGGIDPARWLYLKVITEILAGHFHRTKEHAKRGARADFERAWTTGCLCKLKPEWLKYNEWNHGAAIVELYSDDTFTVENFWIGEGKIL